jgi:hypothetical protein
VIAVWRERALTLTFVFLTASVTLIGPSLLGLRPSGLVFAVLLAAGDTTLLLDELLGSTGESAETDIVEDTDEFGENDTGGSDDDTAGTDTDGDSE